MFCDVSSDIYRQIVQHCARISYQEREKYCNEQIIILDGLVSYFNDNLKKTGKGYKCVYPGIDDYKWIYNYETYLRKKD